MLQQTQAAVVIPYFARWMELFPTVEVLAAADPELVLKSWEGLGYYSRARNLHAAAKEIVTDHGGKLPQNPHILKTIKGIGPYTVGAIRSFAFKQKSAAVDGNVKRVLARYFAIEGTISHSSTNKQIWAAAEALLPDERPWEITEGLIELGATVCMRSAQCNRCPLRTTCQAHLQGRAHELPVKATRVAITPLCRTVAVISAEGRLLVRQGAPGQLMAGLYEFPYFEDQNPGMCSQQLTKRIYNELQLQTEYIEVLERELHSFTRYRAELIPHYLTASEARAVAGFQWLLPSAIDARPLSAGHRRIYQKLQ
jgi:A/G-specific adenine glycosylase